MCMHIPDQSNNYVYRETCLIRSLYNMVTCLNWPMKKIPKCVIYIQSDLCNVATCLIRLGNFGPKVTSIDRFHCIMKIIVAIAHQYDKSLHVTSSTSGSVFQVLSLAKTFFLLKQSPNHHLAEVITIVQRYK